MTRPRRTLVSLDATPYYHCVCRCVRRAFLCGKDLQSGESYEHRRQWIEDRLHQLASIFSIKICAYAVMHNHYHVVLHVDTQQAMGLSRDEVIRRWLMLFSGNVLAQRYIKGNKLTEAELNRLDEFVCVWRERLQDISWFMRCTNECIARKANEEDGCTGRFWEGRFKSQALLDEKALLSCMVYVDLNPVRAKIASLPETSDHTSIKKRIEAVDSSASPVEQQGPTVRLAPFVGNPGKDMPQGIPFEMKDYLSLVDWTGRVIREDKRGAISASVPPILERLNITSKQWQHLSTNFESRFKKWVGASIRIEGICGELGKRWVHGQLACKALLG